MAMSGDGRAMQKVCERQSQRWLWIAWSSGRCHLEEFLRWWWFVWKETRCASLRQNWHFINLTAAAHFCWPFFVNMCASLMPQRQGKGGERCDGPETGCSRAEEIGKWPCRLAMSLDVLKLIKPASEIFSCEQAGHHVKRLWSMTFSKKTTQDVFGATGFHWTIVISKWVQQGQPLVFFLQDQNQVAALMPRRHGGLEAIRWRGVYLRCSWRSPYENRIQNLILFGLLFVVCAIADVVQNWAMEKVAVVRTPLLVYVRCKM